MFSKNNNFFKYFFFDLLNTLEFIKTVKNLFVQSKFEIRFSKHKFHELTSLYQRPINCRTTCMYSWNVNCMNLSVWWPKIIIIFKKKKVEDPFQIKIDLLKMNFCLKAQILQTISLSIFSLSCCFFDYECFPHREMSKLNPFSIFDIALFLIFQNFI